MSVEHLFRTVSTRSASVLLLSAALGACATGARQDTAPQASRETKVPAASAPNQLTAQERVAGWRLLFDGKTFSGWRGLGRDTVPTAHWEIVDGAIRKKPSGEVPSAPDGQPIDGGDLTTGDTFTNYELAFDWKVTSGANGGVKYNVVERRAASGSRSTAALGLEYQVLDDQRHPDAKKGVNGNRTSASLYDLVPARADKPLRPVGEWNEARIVFRGNHGEHWLNGVKVLEYDLGTPRMDALFKTSKWSDNPGFITRKPDHRIVLQDHKDEIFYRNIKIRELSSVGGSSAPAPQLPRLPHSRTSSSSWPTTWGIRTSGLMAARSARPTWIGWRPGGSASGTSTTTPSATSRVPLS
jgi:hypothetical protein